MTLFDTCGPTRRPMTSTSTPCGRSTQERDKRLRPEGATQYLELKDDFAEFAEVDPHTPVTPRTPINEDIEVAVLGGGIAGLLAGAYLKKAGVDDVHVIEMAGDFGGVWYWNRFPGIQCDNDGVLLHPDARRARLLPSKKYADGAEIFEHCKRIGKHFGLYDGAIFSTQVRTVRWDESQTLAVGHQPWRQHSGPVRGHDAGFYNRPKLPGIPGIKDFKGHIFHSARWDYDYTGGDANGGRTSCTTSVSRWSEPARRACSWFRISVEILSICTYFSEPRRRWDAAWQRADGSAVGGFSAAWLAGGAQAQLPPLVAVRGSDLRCS